MQGKVSEATFSIESYKPKFNSNVYLFNGGTMDPSFHTRDEFQSAQLTIRNELNRVEKLEALYLKYYIAI